MARMTYNEAAIRAATTSDRWAALTKLDVDVDTVRTWDPILPRHKRILVPIDVQAFVVPTAGGEATVPVAGRHSDPDPFAPATARAPGVHLHWALPDALLRAQHVDGATSITLPALPDRWVVVRTLLPELGRLVLVRGWVVDAANGTVMALRDYTGTTATGDVVMSPLDGASGGTLLWSATYEGARDRFALHDDLADLPALAKVAPNGFHGGRCAYTVAGWWSDSNLDPLASTGSRAALDATLRTLGWHISAESPDDADESTDPRMLALQDQVGLDSPTIGTTVHQVTKYSKQTSRYSDVSPAAATPVAASRAHYIAPAFTHYHSLLHGSVLGVPITGTVGTADDRPDPATLALGIGLDVDDVTAALAAPGFGVTEDRRQAAERLMSALTSDMLNRIATPDGVADLEEREHTDGFWSFIGAQLPNARDDRLRAEDSLALGPTAVGRKGRGALASAAGGKTGSKGFDPGDAFMDTRLLWKHDFISIKSGATSSSSKPPGRTAAPVNPNLNQSRSVTKPAPRLFRPAPPVVGIRGAKPNARHHGDGLFDSEGLRCRWPGECKPGFRGVVEATAILPSLGSGAIPAEVLTVVREAVTIDPYASAWLARAGAPESTWKARTARITAEHIRLYGAQVIYDGSGTRGLLDQLQSDGPLADSDSAWARTSVQYTHDAMHVAQELSRFATLDGAPPSPMAITTWRQPWVPLFVEWKVRVVGRDRMDGWELDGLDLRPVVAGSADLADTIDAQFTGRSPISTGIAASLGTAITSWLDAENARDAAVPSQSQLSDADEAALSQLRTLIAPLDLVSFSMDGIREQLLGIEYLGGMVVRQVPVDQPAAAARPVASGLPVPLFGGQIEVLELRAVDAFGRVMPIAVEGMRTVRSLEVPQRPATIRVAPRVQHGARWLFRLVDPGYTLGGDPLSAPEAYVDQLAGAAAVTPISGYLLPDHMDESLEVFDRFGNPMGELLHDAVSDAVAWEPAPGRPVPPDAGPLTGVPGEFGSHAQHVALLAAGMIRVDVDDRHSPVPATRSALSALLRAIDTTLWSIDTFQSIGSPTIAGLVGRPVAVVRATLRLDVPDDVDELNITEASGADGRRAAFAAISHIRFPVRIGDLGRSDDSVLGFFVDDDYGRFHVVDKVVAAQARESGRHRGHLGLLGSVDVPDGDPIDHPYIRAEDTLLVRPGQVVRLTILMLPAGKVHLTTGIVPRKMLALADDWVTPGLSKLVPSLRVGPVLVDPAEIRMPLVAALGKEQQFIRRTGPLTWREDPIIAANSAALLPRMPHEAQEGWIRVAPADGTKSPGGAA